MSRRLDKEGVWSISEKKSAIDARILRLMCIRIELPKVKNGPLRAVGSQKKDDGGLSESPSLI